MILKTYFDPTKDDPVEYDEVTFSLIGERYKICLEAVIDQINQSIWFSSPLEELARSTANWSILKRQLILGFSIAEAMALDPSNLIKLWEGYARARILPLCAFDDATDKDTLGNLEPHVVAPYVVAAVLKGEEFFFQNPSIEPFWRVLQESLIRIATVVYQEYSTRFDSKYLENPNALLSMYKTELSPLNRSSSFVTYVYGLAAIKNTPITTTTPWLFERSRQLLDDIADLREDIFFGRLTYPALLTLKEPHVGPKAKKIIHNLWYNKNNTDDWWPLFRNCLMESKVLNDLKQQITVDINSLRDWISTSFPGEYKYLLALLEAKRAFLFRLIQHGVDDIPPPSPLDRIGKTI